MFLLVYTARDFRRRAISTAEIIVPAEETKGSVHETRALTAALP
jgi:hypothetical protein